MQPDKLAAYLRHKLPESSDLSVANIARIAGGASRETWSFDASWNENGAAREQGFILRRDPPASLLDGNNELEFELYSTLHGSGVPVPPAHWIERDGTWLERPFFVMGRVHGATDARTLVTSPAYAEARPTISRRKAEILARIHETDLARLKTIDRPAEGESPGAHEIARWEAVLRRDALEPQPVLEMGFNWLKRHIPPPPARLALVHADYRTGNFLYDEHDITGILDWEMAHAGDPIEDVGWLMMKSWRWAGDDRVGGLCARDEFIGMYEAAGGAKVDSDALKFWEVLGNVKFATLFLTGLKSVIEGKTPDLLLTLTAFINPGVEVEIMELIS